MAKRARAIHYKIREVPEDEPTQATVGRKIITDFSDVAGQWTPDPAFDEIIASQRQIGVDGRTNLFERPLLSSLDEIYAKLDDAGAANLSLNRDLTQPTKRESR